MTTTEREPSARREEAGARGSEPEQAIFVTTDKRRSRFLKRGALVASVLASLWLVGLGIGMLGLGSLPSVSFPISALNRDGGQPKDKRADDAARRPPQSTADADAVRRTSGGSPTSATPALRADRRSRSNGRASAPGIRTRSTAPPVVPGPTAQAQSTTPAPGLARRGLTLPPGQEKKATQTQPQPPTPPEKARRRANSQTTTTTTTTTTPPGQQKPEKPPKPPKG